MESTTSSQINTRLSATVQPSSRSAAQESSPTDCKHTHRVCPLCGCDNADQPQSRYSREPWLIKNCGECGLVYLENVLQYDELAENHTWTDSFSIEREFRRKRAPLRTAVTLFLKRARLRLFPHNKAQKLIRQFVQSGKLLDIGCGVGAVLKKLDKQITPYGVEIEKDAAKKADQYARQRGGRVYQADALSGLAQLEENSFDGVLMQAYLEHENQPLLVLEQTCRILRPGGVLIIKVPNYGCLNRHLRQTGWPGFRYPDHVNYYTPATLVQSIGKAGLSIARFSLRDRLPTSDNLWLIARKG